MSKSKKDLKQYISGLETSPFFFFLTDDPEMKKDRKKVETEDEIEEKDYQALVNWLQTATVAND